MLHRTLLARTVPNCIGSVSKRAFRYRVVSGAVPHFGAPPPTCALRPEAPEPHRPSTARSRPASPSPIGTSYSARRLRPPPLVTASSSSDVVDSPRSGGYLTEVFFEQVEHEYKRCGALNLLGALDTSSGQVWGEIAPRKRQVEFLALLEQIDTDLPASVTSVYLVLDNVRMHTGNQVLAWLVKHPRFVLVHPPVHCSWMNQIEQWFSILVRKRLQIADFVSKEHLTERLEVFIQEWNERAHAFRWMTKSFEKILAKCEKAILKAA